MGVYAKRTKRPGSDIDLLVVTDLDGDPPFHLRRARLLASECFPPVDVVFATLEDFAAAAKAKSGLLLSILERVIIVYRRR